MITYHPDQEWLDERFKRNGSSVVQLKATAIWTPELYFFGFIQPVMFQEWDRQLVTIYSSGKVIMRQQLQYSGYCQITAEFFPYDMHQCSIAMQHGQHNVLLTPKTKPMISPSIAVMHHSWWIR